MGEPNENVIPVTIEFTGGLEILFSSQKIHHIKLPSIDENRSPSNIAYLVRHLCQNLMKDHRKELFVLDDTVRPGILVLINDADWELEGEDKYELQKGDHILFVSTLHGG